MHSNIFGINCTVSESDISDDDYGRFGIDYCNDDVDEVHTEWLNDIMPPFIKVDNNEIVVADDSIKQYNAWIMPHVHRVHEWQIERMKSIGMHTYFLKLRDVCTENADKNKWEPIRSLFYMDDELLSYLQFVSSLALYCQGETLKINNAIDYHY